MDLGFTEPHTIIFFTHSLHRFPKAISYKWKYEALFQWDNVLGNHQLVQDFFNSITRIRGILQVYVFGDCYTYA